MPSRRVPDRRWLPSVVLYAALVVVVVSAAAGGCAVGGLLAVAWVQGRFESWHRLPAAPLRPTALVDVANDALTVESEDGRAYRYRVDTTRWEPVPEPFAASRPPSDLEVRAEYRISMPPGRPVARRVSQTCQHGEACQETDIVLLDDGALYRWHHADSGLASLFAFLVGIVGGGTVAAVGGVVLATRLARARWP